ncbi:hypothetical protein [Rhizobiales bacterium 3FA27D7]|jgi:hypothetical protein|uniref:hypothetical protein n=1 Tax=Mesorhizobium sp. 2RAF21 TaxID=3232995 RepID=UPI0010F61078
MRKISWTKALLTTLLVTGTSGWQAHAEDVYKLVQNQNGFDLPGVTLPQGQDEVRAADGTTCSSSISGSGAYLDMGVIRNSAAVTTQDMAAYGRVVIPLGSRPKRLDCSRLYNLEVERLQIELDLMKMGVGPDAGMSTGSTKQAAPATAAVKHQVKAQRKNWVSEGWSARGDGGK